METPWFLAKGGFHNCGDYGKLKIEILFYQNLTKYINIHNYGNPPISKFFFNF